MKKILIYILFIVILSSFASAGRQATINYDDYLFLYFGNGTSINDIAGGKGSLLSSNSGFVSHGNGNKIAEVTRTSSPGSWDWDLISDLTTGTITAEWDMVAIAALVEVGFTPDITNLGISMTETACTFKFQTDIYFSNSTSAVNQFPFVGDDLDARDQNLTYVMVADLDNNKCSYAIYNTTPEPDVMLGSVNDTTMQAVRPTLEGWHMMQGQGNEPTLLMDNASMYLGNGIVDGKPGLGSPGVPANPTWLHPATNNQKNRTNITVNVSHSGALADIGFYFYVDDDIIFDNVTGNESTFLAWETDLSDGEYIFKAIVQNVTSGIFSSNISRTWTLDTTNPIITLNENNSFNISNIATINQYANYLFLDISAEDETGLFGFEINITKAGISYFNYSNTTFVGGNLTFNYTTNISLSSWPSGVFTVNVSASDSHTANSIDDYDVSNGINTIEFNTIEGNRIEISSDGSAYSTLYNKKIDKYEFGWNYLLTDSTRKFTVESDNKIYYLPNSKYTAHFVIQGKGINGNWIDFEGIGKDYSVKKINDRKYEITFTNLPLTNQIVSKSLGGVNLVVESYRWYKGNYTDTSPTASTFGNVETFSLNITRNTTFARPNVTFVFDEITYSTTTTTNEDHIIFSRDLSIPNPSGSSALLDFEWVVNITQSDDTSYTFNISNSLNISESLMDDCSVYNTTILSILGKDEETNKEVNTTLNIVLFSKIVGTGINNSYELSGKSNYTFCTDSGFNFTIDSIMEYGDGTIYTDRKYYLNNFTIDTSITAEVFLYNLNNSKASEITLTVFDTTTGDKVPGAFIKILRFYPGENVLRTVEIEKTDEVGETLGKMVLADVFYKFIIEKPAGTVKFASDVLRILSLTRSFGISFATDVLDTWDKIHGVSTSVTCTKGTQTCRITWSDTSNIVRDATLEVWRSTGITDTLLSTQTTTSAAGTISYTIVEDTTGRAYTAKGFIESNTGTSLYGVGIAGLIFSDNPFFTDEAHRIASLFPLFLLVVVIVFSLIDFGVVGITIGSLLGLIIGSIIGILPIDPFYLISFILLAVILIYKLSK